MARNPGKQNYHTPPSLLCPVSGLPVFTYEQWTDIELSAAYRVTFEKIGDHILRSVPAGYPDTDGMSAFFEKRAQFLQETGLGTSPFVEIKDYSGLTGQTPQKSRDMFVHHLQEEQDSGSILGFFGYNAGFIIKTLFNIGMNVYSAEIPVVICNDYSDAVEQALTALNISRDSLPSDITTRPLPVGVKDVEKHYPKHRYGELLKEHIEALYTYINSINWDDLPDPGIHKMKKGHPFAALYSAIEVLRTDFRDAIEHKEKVEENLIELNREMEKKIEERTGELARKNTILETSLSILSHDTKNLFFNISYLIDQELGGPVKSMFKDSFSELYDNIMETTGYIKEHVRIFSLIDILKKIRVTPDRIPLESHHRIDIQFEGVPELYYVETNTLFKNAVTNIVENALKYTAEEKRILIDIRNSESADYICIKIIDNGPGIPDGEKEKIFKKGFRRKETEAVSGTGQGLWITRNIITKAGGNLQVSDNPSGGTVFCIQIPSFHLDNYESGLNRLSEWFSVPQKIIKERAENLEMLIEMNGKDVGHIPSFIFVSILNQLRLENKENSKENIRHKLFKLQEKNKNGPTVLIVDDSLYVHYYLGTYFTELGYRIAGFEFNGKRGVEAYAELKPDIITLDNTMPILNGTEAAKKISETYPDAKIIFITAMGDSSEMIADLSSLPGDSYRILTKPIKKEELQTAIAELSEA